MSLAATEMQIWQKLPMYFALKVVNKNPGRLFTGSTISTLLHDRINPKDCQVLSLGDTGFLQIFRVVSRDYGKPRSLPTWNPKNRKVFWVDMGFILWHQDWQDSELPKVFELSKTEGLEVGS